MAITKVSSDTAEHTDALAALRKWFPAGTTAHTVYMHGNKTGDGHTVKLLAVTGNGEVFNASYAAARVLGRPYDDSRGGVYMRGGGMDMAYALAWELSKTLHGDGYALSHRAI